MIIAKRDGRLTTFNLNKIEMAILKSFEAVDGEVSDYAKEKYIYDNFPTNNNIP